MMMLCSFSRCAKPRWPLLRQFSTTSPPFSAKQKFSSLSASKIVNRVDEEFEGFLPWLERKAGVRISSKLYIGKSAYGKSSNMIIFWSESELDMIRQRETINQKAQIEKDFLIIKQTLKYILEIQGSITLKDFMHAYALDFLNHDGVSEAFVLNDDDKQVSEVIADRNYSPHEEVLIRYGKFSNATLLLEFGFMLSNNMHDQVQIQINLPDQDLLRETKMENLQRHHLPAIKDTNGFKLSGDEVRSAGGKGRGLPQSLRAFAHVQTCSSPQDLSDLIVEASQKDGRLARCPVKDTSKEILKHEILLSHFTQLIEKRKESIESLQPVCSTPASEKFALRKQMALDLLKGELRVLESASAWLKNYCATFS